MRLEGPPPLPITTALDTVEVYDPTEAVPWTTKQHLIYATGFPAVAA